MPDMIASAVDAHATQNMRLDRVAAAADQAVVVEALSRTLILFGLLIAGACLWPPANLLWAGMFSLVSGTGVLVILPYRLAGCRWLANVE